MSTLQIIAASVMFAAYGGLSAVKLYALWKLSQIQMPEPPQLSSDAPAVPFYYGPHLIGTARVQRLDQHQPRPL